MYSFLFVENIFDNFWIIVIVVDNLKRKLFIESVNIRLRYVFCFNFFDEYVIIMIKRFRIIMIFLIKKIFVVIRLGLKEVKEGLFMDKFVLFFFWFLYFIFGDVIGLFIFDL